MFQRAVEDFCRVGARFQLLYLGAHLGRSGLAAQSPRNVARMAQCRGLVAFKDLGIQVFTFAAANGANEVGEVTLAFAFRCEGAYKLAFLVEQRVASN